MALQGCFSYCQHISNLHFVQVSYPPGFISVVTAPALKLLSHFCSPFCTSIFFKKFKSYTFLFTTRLSLCKYASIPWSLSSFRYGINCLHISLTFKLQSFSTQIYVPAKFLVACNTSGFFINNVNLIRISLPRLLPNLWPLPICQFKTSTLNFILIISSVIFKVSKYD